MLISLSLALHILAAAVWVGGMFFAYVCLRPALGEREPAERLAIFVAVFKRFFPWVSVAIAILFVTGLGMIYLMGGFGSVGLYVHIMFALAIVMTVIFKFLLLAPYRHLTAAVEEQNLKVAAYALGTIRKLVLTNLILGVIVIIVAAGLKTL